MALRAPDGAGIKGGKTQYYSRRMLTALELLRKYPKDGDFIVTLIVYHARHAARAALDGIYHGRRPA